MRNPEGLAAGVRIRARLARKVHSAWVECGDDLPVASKVVSIDLWEKCKCHFSLRAFSNALLEAMACGCAVIASRVGGTPELIGPNEERGLLFESGDARDLAARVTRLISDEAFRLRLGRCAAKFAKEKLSIQVAVECTASMYERLLFRKVGNNHMRP